MAKIDQHSEYLSIGELAKAAGVHIETIRFYQRKGLLNEPARPSRGIRRYGSADCARIRFVKSAQKLGFNLDEVAILLKLDDGTQCEEASKIAQQKLTEIRSKLADLQRIEDTLSKLVAQCQSEKGQVCCPVIASLNS